MPDSAGDGQLKFHPAGEERSCRPVKQDTRCAAAAAVVVLQKLEPKNSHNSNTPQQLEATGNTALTHVFKEHLFSINDLLGVSVENTKVYIL